MEQKFSLQTIDSYVADLLEKTGISQLPESDRANAISNIRAMFEKSVAATALAFMNDADKQELMQLSKEGDGEKVLAFLAGIVTPELEQALFSGLEKVKEDFLEYFYQQI